jgi:TrmH family RNA methyltransferase
MLGKKEIKDIQSLSLKKRRDETGLFIAEGPKLVNEIINTIPESVIEVFATSDWKGVVNPKLSVRIIEQYELEKISQLTSPVEVLAVVGKMKNYEPQNFKGFCLYLDTIQDPGNLGTIIRTADWFGLQHVVCSAGCADLYNPKVVQATMGSFTRINVWYDKAESWIEHQTGTLLAATLIGQSLYSLEKIDRGILMIGNESKGLRSEVIRLATHMVSIPRFGKAESLNASVAAGIILSHLMSNESVSL